MNRSKARECAFRLIFQYIFQPDDIAELVESFLSGAADSADQAEYIRNAVLGVAQKSAELDAILAKYSVGWDLSRISRVSNAAMRLALYETRFCGLPAPVAIDEAVHLVKKYDGDEVVNFVNGILGKASADNA